MSIILPYMVRSGEQQHVTEPYVSVPPALTITDETGAIWTLGFRFGEAPRGEFAFNVLRNGVETGEIASRIERRQGRILVFTAQGWKWMKVVAVGQTQVFGVGARLKSPPSSDNAAVEVTVYFDHQLSTPVAVLPFNPRVGGVKDLSATPLCCPPGHWLSATIKPTGYERLVEVVGYLGEKRLRAIPIVNPVTVED